MNWHHLFNWLPSRTVRRTRRARTPLPRWRFALPCLERLEDRIAPAIVTPFSVRFSANTTGDIAVVANTLETASTVGNPGRTQQDVINAQNGTGSFINNNDWNMAYVNVGPSAIDPNTGKPLFDSSQASLGLPAGAKVLFAGLYWGGNAPSSPLRSQVLFSTPTSGGYTSINGTIIGDSTAVSPAPNPPGPNYEGFANVTSLVQAGGNGTYTVADVQASIGTNLYAGWSLVVAYQAPGDPPRNLTVFDGYAVQANGNPALNIPISGFKAPPSGPVNAKVGVVAYEGDKGITGDSMALNRTALSDALNPANNFFNSTISNQGVLVTAKNPNYVDQLGFDAKIVKVPSGVIKNGDTSATITLQTTGDTYFPGVVTTSIDLFAPNLVETKSVTDLTSNGGAVTAGDILQYTVNVTNTGQDAAGNVVLTDPIPAGTTYVPGSLQIVSGPNAGAQTDAAGDDEAEFNAVGNDVVFRLGAGANAATGGVLVIGASTAITFRVQVDPGTPANAVVANQATTTYKGVTTGFPFTSTSAAAAVTVANSQADLALTKTVSNPTPNVGDRITYTITLTNNGPGTANGVTVTDLVPPGLQLVNATTSQGEYDSGSGLWTVGTVAKGASTTLTIIALVTSPDPQTNTAVISGSDAIDPNPSNNTASVLETPQQADLSIKKTVSNPRPNVGDTITYTVSLTDNGPNTATGVTVIDPLPAGLTFVSATPSQGSYDPTTGIWTVGTVTTTTPPTLQIKATVVSPDATTNTATISHADQFDPDPGNNSASVLETPQQADLVLSKVTDNPTPNKGDTIHYIISLADAGPNTATNVAVQDSLPSGVTFVSSSATQGSYDPTTGVWTVGTVATSAPQTLMIAAVVNEPEEMTNTATISHADQFDPNPSNNTASSVVAPVQADLELVKRVDNPTPNVGDVITYTVTLTDNGPSNATGVTVRDPLPAGLTFVSDTASEGSYDPTTGIWTVGAVASGTPQTLQIKAMVVSPDPQTNTATITHSDQFDPNPNNNSSSATETPQQADLSLFKTVDNPAPNVGDTIHYTITLADAGPDAATNVTVQDLLPAGVAFVSASASQGSYNPTTGIWTVGTVGTTAAQTLTITALVTGPGALTNTATITHSDQFDPDPANNTADTTVTTQQADLELIKRVDNPTPNVGDTITYTLTLTDNGPVAASGVAVSDRLPAGLTFVSDTASEGSYDPTTGIWTVGTVTTAAPQTLQIKAMVVSPHATTNLATVAHSDQFDPDPDNDSSSVTVTPQQAVLTVTKEVDNPTPNVGDIIHYTIAVNDAGPDAATNVTIQDLLPAGLQFVSATSSEGTYNPTTGVWTVGTVDTTAAQTLTVGARVTGPVTTTNTATVSHADQFDPNPARTFASAAETPQQADLTIAKDVDNLHPNVGDTITYTVTLTDNGPDPATNVTVEDSLPAGLTFVSATPSLGTYDPATGVWTVGTVDPQSIQTLQIFARVVSPNPQTNTATISRADQFDPDLDNNSASATETPIIVPPPPPPPTRGGREPNQAGEPDYSHLRHAGDVHADRP